MLHAVAACPWQVVGDECVGGARHLERGKDAEDVARLADDPLDVGGEGLQLRRSAIVVHGESNRGTAARAATGAASRRTSAGNSEGLERKITHLRRAVHQ